MKKLAIILVLLLLLGGAGGAGWWFFLRAQPEAGSAEAVEEESLIRATRAIRLDPIILPVIREGQVTLHVTVVIVIELTKAVPLSELRVFSHPLRDSMLSELHGMYASRYVQERGYNLPVVKERLSKAAERVLGAGSVRGVLLKDLNKRALDTG
jgi:flagellar basal body-associated protein FliL